MMLAVIRLRGNVGLDHKKKDTLQMLNLDDKYSCTVVPESDDFVGMLKKVKNFVTWGEIDEDVLEDLLSKRARFKDGAEINSESLEARDFSDFEELVDDIIQSEKLETNDIRPCISLSPPSGGFNGKLRNIYPQGEAGYRGDKINELLNKMI